MCVLYYTFLTLSIVIKKPTNFNFNLKPFVLNFFSAICGTISLVIFGIHGNSRTWMPQWEHKCVGWSYFVAVVGIIIIYISGVSFITEERTQKIKIRKTTPQTANPHSNQSFDNV